MDNKLELRIQEVSKKLELPRSTIRYWETEFPEYVQPKRTNGGQRRYTSENISMIEEIKRMKEMGMSLSDIKRKLDNSEEGEFQGSGKIDFLANRVAKLVKGEISVFLKRELNNSGF